MSQGTRIAGRVGALLLACGLATSAHAAIAVAVFPATVTDPNLAIPLSTALYSSAICGLPKYVEVLPIVNPTYAYYDDPGNSALDCRIEIAAQLTGLPQGTYTAAGQQDGALYEDLTTAFEVVPVIIDTPPAPEPTPKPCRGNGKKKCR